MCLLFCFVLFWIFCCVVCEKIKIKIVDNKKKKNTVMVQRWPPRPVRSRAKVQERPLWPGQNNQEVHRRLP